MRANKRQQVVDKATELFSRYGFHPVGVDRIIDESGVARMTLYRHFAGKEDLVKEVLEQRYTMIYDSIEEKLRLLDDPLARVKGIFDWYEGWFASPEFAGCLFERALAEFGTAHPGISSVAIRYRKHMADWITEILQPVMDTKAAARVAEIMVMLLDGATVDARAYGDPKTANRAWQAAQVLLEQARQSAKLSSGQR
ncbi:MAG TPA: TetR/AcrR family transcriptional regulator [Bordetella sp.]|nr:TetR/AcrR family transcriptional regulator [Bordetella sp.]